ncbi:MAG: hypothetical protein A2X49_06350 [Lentisphaerae bacterium GWF2_52_8]|nr:MAG: hypothetical protein A2X49_06350 [Lentisphaerae bacterium GWF2_52_8]
MKMRTDNGIAAVLAFRPEGLLALCLALMSAFSLFAQDPEAPAPVAEKATSAVSEQPVVLSAEEQSARLAAAEKAAALVAEAKNLCSNGKFADADSKCREARTEYLKLGESANIRLQLEKIGKLIADIHVKWAMARLQQANEAYLKKDYKEAESLAKNAGEINSNRETGRNYNDELDTKIDAFVKQMNKYADSAKYVEDTKLTTIDPPNKERKEEIHVLFEEAKILYKNQLYSQARDSLEKILIKDPYNQEAIEFLRKIYIKLYAVATKRRENEALERLAETEWKWNQGILPTEAVAPKASGPSMQQSTRSGLYEKLQNIIFDSIEFDDANISSIIQHLNIRSRQLDPDGVGVSIILNLKREEIDTVPKITMTFDHIPMIEAIRYLCQGAGLKYRVEDRAVIIGSTDIDANDTRFFSVRAQLISRITEGASEAAGDAAADNVTGAFGAETGADAALTEDNIFSTVRAGTAEERRARRAELLKSSGKLKEFFELRGIPFENGSAIAYDKRAGKLIVKNTPENLRRLEMLLREIDIVTPLVLIEAKILEITQTDLEELGFDWVFTDTGSMYRDAAGTYSATGAKQNPKWQVAATERVLRAVTTTSRSSSTGNRSDSILKDFVLIPNFMGGDYNLRVTVNAIDQSGRGEVLSSPKVIASSGETAIIRMVEQHYYPTSWSAPTVTTGNGIISYSPAYPEFGDPTDVGIRLEVTPTVSPNNYTISLHLYPQVVSFVQQTQYPYYIEIGNITGTLTIWMPELTHRDLDTNVKVYDGETVVLGGMLRDNTEARNDKWPGLGDIPLLGRLFQSQMNYSLKRNLLIFVTARLMSNDGVPVRPEAVRGVPEYNR